MHVVELPFNRHLGLELAEHEGQPAVCLTPDERHTNHLGTVHAGALFALAEAASGHALLRQLPLAADQVVAVLRSAEVKYRKPAASRLVAVAAIDENAAAAVAEKFAAKGRVLIDVNVRLLEADEEVLAGTFSWFIARRPGT
jgi:uncharacterized protein (TIGR00369 family)